MAPVLVPVPLVVDTPAVGVMAHVVLFAGVPPLAKVYVPLFPAGSVAGPDTLHALGVVHGMPVTVTVRVHVLEAGGVQPDGSVAFTLVNVTVYVPDVVNVIAPVLAPVPLVVDTPVVGDIVQEVALAGVPPLAQAYVPL